MSAEIWQFVGMVAFFAIALFLWLRIVYLPRRTLERWEGQRVETGKDRRQRKDSMSRGHDS